MRFLKRKNLNFRNVKDNNVAVEITGEVKLDNTNVMLMPNGPTANRPGEIGAATATPVNGHMRYNTDTAEVEIYQANAWRTIRFKESTGITQQTAGTGDDTETKFGPLNPAPPTTVESGETWGGQNLIVLVENVFQIHTTNYTIEQNPVAGPGAPYAAGYYIVFDNPVPTGKAVTVLHGFDR